MEKTNVLAKTSLFSGISEAEIEKLLLCLSSRTVDYKKGEVIISQGSYPKYAGIILFGAIEGVKNGYNGELQVISNLEVGDMFGEALISSPNNPSPVNVIAKCDTRAVLLDCQSIMSGCSQACPYHVRLRQNLLGVIADKFWSLNKKLGYISIGSLRARIASYLLDCSEGRVIFSIPFDRAGMAGYLGADRSALSRELSRMKNDLLIEYYKNSFKILDMDRLRKASVTRI